MKSFTYNKSLTRVENEAEREFHDACKLMSEKSKARDALARKRKQRELKADLAKFKAAHARVMAQLSSLEIECDKYVLENRELRAQLLANAVIAKHGTHAEVATNNAYNAIQLGDSLTN